jgi:hypothetical protein
LFPSLTSLPSSPAAIPSFIFRFPHLILPVTFYQLQEEGPMLHGLRCSKLCRFSQVDWQVDVESNCSMWFPKSPEARRFAWWAVPVVVIQKKPRTGSSKLLLHWLQIQSATERERQKETERDASLICNWNPWRLLERFWLTSSKLEKLVCWTVKLPTRIDLFHVHFQMESFRKWGTTPKGSGNGWFGPYSPMGWEPLGSAWYGKAIGFIKFGWFGGPIFGWNHRLKVETGLFATTGAIQRQTPVTSERVHDQNNMRVGPTTSKGIPNRLGMRYERDTE